MKTLLTLFLAILSTGFLSANLSEFRIKSHDRTNIIANIDGFWYGPAKEIIVKGLTPGIHEIAIQKEFVNYNVFDGVTQSFEHVYSGQLNLSPKTIYFTELSTFNDIRIIKTRHIFDEPVVYSPQNGGNQYGYCNPQPVNCGNTYIGMSNEYFSSLIEIMDDESFDSGKLKIAKNAALSNNLTSDQVRVLVSKFTFESNKLDFAKDAYNRVVDPQNYFTVNSAFTFSSSKRELMDYIGGGF